MVTVSVIIPVYNVELHLHQCLDSIVNQTFKNLEIILVDDGSPDNCGVICDEYASKDDRIIVIHKENEGLSAARNDGIRRASGKWIGFVDSDDWCELDYYEKLIAASDGKTADIVFAGGYYREYPDKCKKVQVVHGECSYSDREHIEDLRAGITTYGLPWDKLYRTEFLKEYAFSFDQSMHAFEDFLFNFEVLEKAQSVVLFPYIGYHYRQSACSIANGFNPNKPEINYAFVSRLCEYASKNGTNEKIEDGINSAAICAIAVAMNSYYLHPANPKGRAEIYKELSEMMNKPVFHKAIYSRSNRYLSKRQIVLKYALRMNQGGVLRILHMAKQKLAR